MSCVRFEEICTKPELITLIYKCLTFGEQLRLAAVNKQLKFMFECFIRAGNFRELRAMRADPNSYVVSNKDDEICMILSLELLKDFSQVYVADMEHFSEDMSQWTRDYEIANHRPTVRVEQFFNLTYLQYVDVLLDDFDLELVARHCPQLRELVLLDCYATSKGQSLQIGCDLKISALQQMRKLEKLRVESESFPKRISYKVLHDLLTNTNLKSFRTRSYFVLDEDDAEVFEDTSNIAYMDLKELQISVRFVTADLVQKFITLLGKMKNLSTLRFYVVFGVTDDVLEAIAKSCGNLEEFTIAKGGQFKQIENFGIPPKVKRVYLRQCCGLTHTNLRQLLTQNQIEDFTSINVSYEGTFEDFSISPYIQVLDLDNVSSCDFPSAYVNNHNLKELTWYDPIEDKYGYSSDAYDSDSSEENYCFSFSKSIPLESCINLQTLYIHSGHVPIAPILKLHHLRKIHIMLRTVGITWPYITSILKHPTLTEFTLGVWKPKSLKYCFDIPSEGFVTNVKWVSVCLPVFEWGLDLWLDLFAKNPKMTLYCNPFVNECPLIEKVLSHKSFPKDLKTITFCGHKFACKDLRQQPPNRCEKMDPIMDMVLFNCKYSAEMTRLVLSREN